MIDTTRFEFVVTDHSARVVHQGNSALSAQFAKENAERRCFIGGGYHDHYLHPKMRCHIGVSIRPIRLSATEKEALS